jgi:hypothetical protein
MPHVYHAEAHVGQTVDKSSILKQLLIHVRWLRNACTDLTVYVPHNI